MGKCEDTYMEPVIMQFDNMTAKILRPILTEEERARRMQKIHDSAANLIISVREAKARKNQERMETV